MRLVFVGTADFAVPGLEALAGGDHAVAAVVTQPDRPAGRNKALRPSPVKTSALALGLPVVQPEDIGAPASLEHLRALTPDALIVVAYGQILPPTVLNLPRLGCYNLHGSLLPALRGPAPVNWAVIRGLPTTGVTVIRMDAGVDTGGIVSQRATDIGPRETAGELSARLSRLGADLLAETLPLIDTGAAQASPQPETGASLAPKLAKADGAIDWTRAAADLDRFIRGVTPWPGAFTAIQAGSDPSRAVRIVVHRAQPVEGTGEPGSVIAVADASFTVAAGVGALAVEALQPAGKRAMTAADFVNGYRLAVGSRFLPIEDVHP